MIKRPARIVRRKQIYRGDVTYSPLSITSIKQFEICALPVPSGKLHPGYDTV